MLLSHHPKPCQKISAFRPFQILKNVNNLISNHQHIKLDCNLEHKFSWTHDIQVPNILPLSALISISFLLAYIPKLTLAPFYLCRFQVISIPTPLIFIYPLIKLCRSQLLSCYQIPYQKGSIQSNFFIL